jgi:hypothetical protein
MTSRIEPAPLSLHDVTGQTVAASAVAGADKEKIEARQTARRRRRVPASVLE